MYSERVTPSKGTRFRLDENRTAFRSVNDLIVGSRAGREIKTLMTECGCRIVLSGTEGVFVEEINPQGNVFARVRFDGFEEDLEISPLMTHELCKGTE